jgi:hypothetical protein
MLHRIEKREQGDNLCGRKRGELAVLVRELELENLRLLHRSIDLASELRASRARERHLLRLLKSQRTPAKAG